MIGQTVSHYRILERLGEGGMGVVYKAEDTKLDRTIALKFIGANLIRDADARKRFEREAKAAAGVSHANVCHVYEIADADGHTFLAMEFVDGESLDTRIERGPLALKDALDFARQTAEGLSAAHAKGVVHRDIKPGNLLVAPSGQVKILDFGLALLTEGSKLTQLDTKVGTVAYMSPEQAQGMEVDHRTDIWALGCVLYEMVCGQRPFRGAYDQALLYEIINQEPEPLTGLRTGVPMELEFIVSKCLAKDRDDRPATAQEVARELRTLGEKLKSGRSTVLRGQVVSHSMVQPPAVTTQLPAGPLVRYRVIENVEESADSAQYLAEDTELHRSVSIRVLPQSSAEKIERAQKRKLAIAFGAGALGILIALVHASILLFSSRSSPPQPQPLRRFAFTPESLSNAPFGRLAISPNGQHIVYLGGGDVPKLWVRDIDHEQPRELAGTENAESKGLFWSPDSQFIGFAAGGQLKKVPVQGDPAITICRLPGAVWEGGAWSPDGGSILFSSGNSSPVLHEVPARGGEPKLLFDPETSKKGSANLQPYFLPPASGLRSIVYELGSYSNREIVVKNLETGEREVLANGAFPVYSPSGHILYQTSPLSPGLWALPFSLATLKPSGEAFPVAENAGDPSVAGDGTLVYLDLFGGGRWQLLWRDRAGKKLEVIGQPQGDTYFPALSPDGRQVAVSGVEDSNIDVWVHEVGRSLKRRLTFDTATDTAPIWSPSGKEIVFVSGRQGNGDIYIRPADGTGEPVLLVGTPSIPEIPLDWSPDGKYLLYQVNEEESGADLWYLKRKEDGSGVEPAPFLQTSFNESRGKFSADGRYVAYVSNESGREEVYVRPFPAGDGKWQVSGDGGTQPRWSRDGKELFYVEGDTLMAVPVTTNPSFTSGAASRLLRDASLPGAVAPRYDVSADGRRFVLTEPAATTEENRPSIHVVQNWYEEFRGREEN